MELTSNAFEHHSTIPLKYTCQGENVSPAMMISNLPKNTKTLALIVDDPDAPHGTFDHWIVWNIPPAATIEESAKLGVQGSNGYRVNEYRGPCPPPGSLHHYHFKLYALDTTLNLQEGSSKGELLKAMQGHILEQAELIGTFKR